MKLKRAVIENFKCIRNLDISFESQRGEPRFLTCFVGDNGSGKTTVLQAIALVLSLASGKTPGDIRLFRWNGFIPERIGSYGPPRIVLDLELNVSEAKFITVLMDNVKEHGLKEPLPHDIEDALVPVSDKKDLKLIYERGNVTTDEGAPGLSKVRGRFMVQDLGAAELWKLIPRFGDVFWFDQYRVLGSGLIESEYQYRQHEERKWRQSEISWTVAVNSLRELLVGWWTYHRSERKKSRDLISELQPRIAEIFPGTRFIGVEPREDVVSPSQKDFFFLIEREGTAYDISEMSSGEQAVFEILYEFVRLEIARSIVLIDELELHLHPPQQQALLSALPKLGPDCQFLITTHSSYLENAIPTEEKMRLEGGALVSDISIG